MRKVTIFVVYIGLCGGLGEEVQEEPASKSHAGGMGDGALSGLTGVKNWQVPFLGSPKKKAH
jgi:hypothetical protein